MKAWIQAKREMLSTGLLTLGAILLSNQRKVAVRVC